MKYVIGSDEVGTGSWAGDIVVCAVKAPIGWTFPGLNDSKQLKPKVREQISRDLYKCDDIVFGFAQSSPVEIDEHGLAACLKSCYYRAITKLGIEYCDIQIDGTTKIPGLTHQSIIKGDASVPAIMAASILAKVYRDGLMISLHHDYPHYDLINNVGYGTKKHMQGLTKFGVSAIHRRSYKPIAEMLSNEAKDPHTGRTKSDLAS